MLCNGPSLCVKVVKPQASVAVAVPNALLIAPALGLQPSVKLVPPVVKVAGLLSSVHVAVLAAVEVLPQASLAIHVLVCDREQPELTTGPSVGDKVGVPQASVAVAVPSAEFIFPAEGLQPNARAAPPVVIVGAVTSAVHVTVLDTVAVLLHASLAVNVLVCERPQPVLETAPSF